MALIANGPAIKALREAHGWNGTKFAKAVKISHAHLSNIEASKRRASAPVLRAIADTLGVPLAAITNGHSLEEVA